MNKRVLIILGFIGITSILLSYSTHLIKIGKKTNNEKDNLVSSENLKSQMVEQEITTKQEITKQELDDYDILFNGILSYVDYDPPAPYEILYIDSLE